MRPSLATMANNWTRSAAQQIYGSDAIPVAESKHLMHTKQHEIKVCMIKFKLALNTDLSNPLLTSNRHIHSLCIYKPITPHYLYLVESDVQNTQFRNLHTTLQRDHKNTAVQLFSAYKITAENKMMVVHNKLFMWISNKKSIY